jgi:putative peptide zinc metalloprotease protein
VPQQPGLNLKRRLRGSVSIEADRSNLLGRIYRRAVALIISESQR